MIKKLFFILFVSLNNLWAEGQPTAIVSVAPHKFFVEKIAGDTLNVYLMVPAGSSAHTYEPTPKQMIAASKALIWFRIGETFENKAIKALQSHNPKFKVVDLRKGLDLITNDAHAHHGCCPAGADLHIWLSARMAQIESKTIVDALKEAFPLNKDLYETNYNKFITELRTLDRTIEEILSSLENRNILVSHPAYAYFARDYHLKQHAVEIEGKDPTPQQLTKLLYKIRQLGVDTIYTQPQYNNKAARLVADELDLKVVSLDPYSEHYIKSMLDIAHAFAGD